MYIAVILKSFEVRQMCACPFSNRFHVKHPQSISSRLIPKMPEIVMRTYITHFNCMSMHVEVCVITLYINMHVIILYI